MKLRSLSTTGNKNELLERLQTALKSKHDDTASAESIDDFSYDASDDEELHAEIIKVTEQSISPPIIAKRKLSDTTSVDLEQNLSKKIVLNRNPSISSDCEQEHRNNNNVQKADSPKQENDSEKKVIKLSELSVKDVRFHLVIIKCAFKICKFTETRNESKEIWSISIG